MDKIVKTILVFMFIFACKSLLYSENQVVYGPDDRVMLKDVQDDDIICASDYKALGRSICLIVPKKYIRELWKTSVPTVPYPAGGVDLKFCGKLTDKLATDPKLNQFDDPICSNVLFKDEYCVNGPCGTGVLIGDRSILTCSHMFFEKDENNNLVEHNPSEYVCIFNWTENATVNYKSSYDDNSIGTHGYYVNFSAYNYFNLTGYDDYNGKTLNKIDGLDLAIVKTDRITAKDIVPVNVYTQGDVLKRIKGKKLFTIGHQKGLPLIFSPNGINNPNITFDQAKAYHKGQLTLSQYNRTIFADFDGGPGNSGSPVFIKDKSMKWVVIGIYATGIDPDYTIDVNHLCIAENKLTLDDFNNGLRWEEFLTLDHLNYNRSCGLDCPEIAIQETGPDGGTININKPSRGQNICVTIPTCCQETNGRPFDGLYYVYFTAPEQDKFFLGMWPWESKWITYSTPVYLFRGSASIKICKGIPSNMPYNVKMYQKSDGEMVYNFHVSGTAYGDELIPIGAVEHNLAKAGVNTNTFCFVPNINSGSIPLDVCFIPNVPGNQCVSSWNWDFGDGNTSTCMYPANQYTKAGIFTVKATATFSDSSKQSYTAPNCISVNEVITSFQNMQNISSSTILFISDINTSGQSISTTCTAPFEINILPETYLVKGTEIKLKIQ